MRLLAAFVMLGLAFELTRWIKRRHQHQQDGADPSRQFPGSNGGELQQGGGGEVAKVEDAGEPERLLTTRGVETVAAMIAFVLILAAIILVLRMIVRF